MTTIEVIRNIMDKSWFDLDKENDSNLTYSTRRHGDTGAEETGEQDFEEALKLKKLLKMQLSNKISVEIDEVDEWVFLDINIL